MRFSTSDLYIVRIVHEDAYSFDTSPPNEIFSSKEEAQEYADEMNRSSAVYAESKNLSYYPDYRVQDLDSRIDTIINESYNSGENNARNSGFEY